MWMAEILGRHTLPRLSSAPFRIFEAVSRPAIGNRKRSQLNFSTVVIETNIQRMLITQFLHVIIVLRFQQRKKTF
jgi:hypothetical protein